MRMTLSKTGQTININDTLLKAYEDVYKMEFSQVSLDGLSIPVLSKNPENVEDAINKALQETIEFSVQFPKVIKMIENGEVVD